MPQRQADADLAGDSESGHPSVRTSSLIAADWLSSIGIETRPVDRVTHELRQEMRVAEYFLPSAELNPLEIELEVRDDSAGRETVIHYGSHRFSVKTLRDVLEMVLSLGRICGMHDAAMRLLAEGEKRIAMSTPVTGAPRVTVLTSIDPPTLGRRWIPGLVELTGAHVVGSSEQSRPIPSDAVAQLDPDVLLIVSTSQAPSECRRALKTQHQAGHWADVRAVANGRVLFIDGSRHLIHPGPWIYESVVRLRGHLNSCLK